MVKRNEIIQSLQDTNFDLVVIGGGITGAGIALDAAQRGMKVALVEKNDFASGTSGKSTKLIHGGLRYLKQLDFGLVREVGLERAIVHKMAPHITHPEKMLLPIYKEGSLSKWTTSIGLGIYDFLANVKGEDKKRMMPAEEALELEPLLNKEGLVGAAYYAEYRTDDTRLTIEVIKHAQSLGAVVLNYCGVEDFIYENNLISGVRCRTIDGQELVINSKIVVSATGPWVDELRKIDDDKSKKQLLLSKGIHIVVSQSKLPLQQSIYFDVPADKRMIFAIPRANVVYIGTTDTVYQKSKEDIFISEDDIQYLLQAVNDSFAEVEITKDDILSTWGGLRPLIQEEGKSSSEVSRKDEIFESESGLISIAGGKLTGFRMMAKRTVDLVGKKLKINVECKTDKIKLGNHQYDDYQDVLKDMEHIQSDIVDQTRAFYLISNYSKQAFELVKDASSVDDIIRNEIIFVKENEFVRNFEDLAYHRTGLGYFYTDWMENYKRIFHPSNKINELGLN